MPLIARTALALSLLSVLCFSFDGITALPLPPTDVDLLLGAAKSSFEAGTTTSSESLIQRQYAVASHSSQLELPDRGHPATAPHAEEVIRELAKHEREKQLKRESYHRTKLLTKMREQEEKGQQGLPSPVAEGGLQGSQEVPMVKSVPAGSHHGVGPQVATTPPRRGSRPWQNPGQRVYYHQNRDLILAKKAEERRARRELLASQAPGLFKRRKLRAKQEEVLDAYKQAEAITNLPRHQPAQHAGHQHKKATTGSTKRPRSERGSSTGGRQPGVNLHTVPEAHPPATSIPESRADGRAALDQRGTLESSANRGDAASPRQSTRTLLDLDLNRAQTPPPGW